ncbi:MAG: hypothetical protein CV087_14625 [Candidatus Brocadia sp. WS118]|nr:MAG: hypothetical protein CV087_14625 [Candidatus Brocadia sp. WS118]
MTCGSCCEPNICRSTAASLSVFTRLVATRPFDPENIFIFINDKKKFEKFTVEVFNEQQIIFLNERYGDVRKK